MSEKDKKVKELSKLLAPVEVKKTSDFKIFIIVFLILISIILLAGLFCESEETSITIGKTRSEYSKECLELGYANSRIVNGKNTCYNKVETIIID